MLWYSLEVPQCGTSNEYPQRTVLCRNKKNINTFWLKKASSLEICPSMHDFPQLIISLKYSQVNIGDIQWWVV